MKRMLLVVGIGFVLCGGRADASQFSDRVGKTWGYLFSPVNAVTQFIADASTCLLASGVRFVQTVVSNANPRNLIP